MAKPESLDRTPKGIALVTRNWRILFAALASILLGGFSIFAFPTDSRTDEYKAGETFKDCPDCPEMLVIPAGEFTMGSPSSETGRFENEGPQHRVTIGYLLAVGKYEVTVAEFAQFATDTGYVANSGCYYWTGSRWALGVHYSWWSPPGFDQTSSEPVVCVTWNDAKAYVDWLSKRTRKSYCLLSEAEWEYASRGGVTSPRPWGAGLSHEDANYGTDECCQTYSQDRDQWRFTAPVGSFAPNRFGLYDMMGNVWEWVDDCWNENYVDAPIDGSSWQSGDCLKRVIRGGSWYSESRRVRSAVRYAFGKGVNRTKVGFRVGRDL